MAAQMEAGHCCPITMTNAAVPVPLQQPDLAAEWLPSILPHNYDPSFAPAGDKIGVTLGMGMTEKQGGTDVRATTTKAEPASERRPGRRLPHHRPQMVPVGADVGCFPCAGTGAGRAVVFSDAALSARTAASTRFVCSG